MFEIKNSLIVAAALRSIAEPGDAAGSLEAGNGPVSAVVYLYMKNLKPGHREVGVAFLGRHDGRTLSYMIHWRRNWLFGGL